MSNIAPTGALWCIIRENHFIFKITIRADNDLIDLRNVIKNVKPNYFANVDADELILWRTNVASNILRNKETAIEPYLNKKLEDPADTVGNTFQNVVGNNIRVIPLLVSHTIFFLLLLRVIFANNTEYLLILVLFFPDSYRQTRPKNTFALSQSNWLLVVMFHGIHRKTVDEKLTNFWKALKNTAELDDNDFLELSGEAHFFGKNSKPSKLLIRKYYDDLILVVFDDNGGILRYVLAGALNTEIQSQLKDAIGLCDENIFRYIGRSESKDDVSHKLVHIWTNLPGRDDAEPYTQKIIKFASDYVVKQVTSNVKRMITNKLFMNLDEVLNGGKSNSVLGSYFESIAHQMLRSGWEFQIHFLDTKKKYTFKLSQQDEHRFSNINETKNEMYYQPIDKTFPSIDAIYAPDTLFQMTTSLNHNIKMIGLNKLQSKLMKTGDIDFYFVVPAQLFDNYKKQNYATIKDVIATNVNPWIIEQIKQYVLRIDLGSEDSLARMSSTATIEERISTLSTADEPLITPLARISTLSTADKPLTDDADPSTVPAKRSSSYIERGEGSKKESKKRNKKKKK
ncbi:hypothetical protein GLOIN_2v1486671 [Rhizophagus irregularis DAOM 181602=DAOM 197198]|uniref:Crinkler effector protein N-terminal domain-containing protein n=1 Tax=Rhizophagus irregularis (strain DAOM 181602 / DAOM 197198 / MUCL 43194) TaxID=747089 RepID=A0A2P4P698_RHIID|nr:hypothetical protein GLOIN_2v1486671 [Rhizophagus irregularis DAOM 181602=DAOM 197198]POG60910.1 hypothetical protein GLOIN_2v1486671 [Rhizophagus irregularis DAOM 181602=DAOM 197198]|eukprot:XP_025167776.1 hypothetical protein GLOIN_2v1486671 [Rhizophagus irregularis DAOM 181602=DAOM 197198]